MKDMHKILLRIWLVLWLVTLPLVHIHPEADHAHATSGHVHGGSYHSILVNTPVHAHQGHAHEEHQHDGFFSPGNSAEPVHSSPHPSYDFEEATYGFSILKPSLSLDSEKSQPSYELAVAAHTEPIIVSSNWPKPYTPIKIPFSILSKNVSSRAPPFS